MADIQSIVVPEEPMYTRKLTLLQRIKCAIHVHVLKFLATNFFRILRLPAFTSRTVLPTLTKVYPDQQPRLEHRVFIPRSHKSGDALLPLYLDIHGGGFALMNPSSDDDFCSTFSNEHKIVVISVDYPKSPEHPFPEPPRAVIKALKAIINDESLPIDKSKIALGGFSAGGNLSFAAAQDPELRSKIRGVVGFYPPVNWCTPLDWKYRTRPADAPQDVLQNMIYSFDWAYLKSDQDLRDPQLSVALAPRDTLPPKICLFGCELDLLCRDSELMAEKLASSGDGKRVGNNLVWEQNGVRWEKLLGVEHGFDAMPAFDKEKEARLKKRAKEMFDSAAEWLFREVYV